MKLRINALRLTLATNKGPYGVTAAFDGGLNVIRAENTSGKSAIMNSILYALGLEILVGKRGLRQPSLSCGAQVNTQGTSSTYWNLLWSLRLLM